MHQLTKGAALATFVACTPATRCPPVTESAPPPTSEATSGEPEWPLFACTARLNETLTVADGFQPELVLRRAQHQLEIETILDPGLSHAALVVESYRMNGTRYFVATTRPDVTKIHYSFFLYVNDQGRGSFELRSLSGSVRIGYYDLVCTNEG
jgi:hypothetical protein